MVEIKDVYEEKEIAEETFRDHLSTVDKKGERIWLYPKKPQGKLTTYRTVVNILLLSILLTGPFIKINGQPLLLLDVLDRKFIIFGQIFWPQDFFLFGLGMITIIVAIILFTVAFGRIFCGWICPQTIFMEGVFRRIEYWIEGDYMSQKKLNKAPWNKEKILKKTFKQFLFVVVSVIITHTFLAYFIGIEQLYLVISEGPLQRPGEFITMIAFNGIFYGVFSRLREQVCTTICPYGRLQGVLLDKKSVVVAYDHKRGEKRGKFRKKENRKELNKGDCIDCKQCVYVCPTGIDIRNGTQLECINCTACIDACNTIMDHIGKPRGLIRFASLHMITNKIPFRFTGRMQSYAAVLIILVGVLISLLMIRSDIETTILRTPGVLYQERTDGSISNLYQIKMINKTNQPMGVHFELIEPKGILEMVGENIFLKEQGIGEGAFFVVIKPEHIKTMSSKISIGVFSDNKKIETVKTKFLGPVY